MLAEPVAAPGEVLELEGEGAAAGGECFEQSGERPGLTTIAGRTEAVGATTVLRCPEWSVALLAAGRVPADVGLQVEGWLTVEPFLWVPDGELARDRPEGRVGWTGSRVRVVGDAAEDLDRLPGETGVDPDAAYVLDLTR